ncbi:hypothetical protein V1477_007010 [Vespula maculifrons]|uniref:Uncharacterized protein n=1 Tax=Vespula maculifrons TaxID=7453 RepID=A0ABD2CJV2_VESMC
MLVHNFITDSFNILYDFCLRVKCGSGDTLHQLNAVVGVLYLVRRYKGRTDSQWFNLIMNFNEYTSHYTQYAYSASNN